ncbi:MAG: ELWxxDGT repeat protein [Planctomycetota bacterium]
MTRVEALEKRRLLSVEMLTAFDSDDDVLVRDVIPTDEGVIFREDQSFGPDRLWLFEDHGTLVELPATADTVFDGIGQVSRSGDSLFFVGATQSPFGFTNPQEVFRVDADGVTSLGLAPPGYELFGGTSFARSAIYPADGVLFVETPGELWAYPLDGSMPVPVVLPVQVDGLSSRVTTGSGHLFYTNNGRLIGIDKSGIATELFDGGSIGYTTARILSPLGDKLLFSGKVDPGAFNPYDNLELFITDGTPAGTKMVKEIRPGNRGSRPIFGISDGERVVFQANDGTHGAELWETDGTAAGTRMLADVAPGQDSSYPGHMAFGHDGAVYFTTDLQGDLAALNLGLFVHHGDRATYVDDLDADRPIISGELRTGGHGVFIPMNTRNPDLSDRHRLLSVDPVAGVREILETDFMQIIGVVDHGGVPYFVADHEEFGQQLWRLSPFARTTAGVLDVTGTAGDDLVRIEQVGDQLRVSRDGSYTNVPVAEVNRIEIDLEAGDDTLVSTGQRPTYVLGGAGDDTIYTGDANDTLTGGAGRNRLFGGGGNDRLKGSGGRDFLRGGPGNDRLYGLGGQDDLAGEGNVDRLFGGDGPDWLKGGGSNDKLYGEAGDDILNGENDNDLLLGGPGNDLLDGKNGHDTLHGHDGDDTLYANAGNDQLHGGTGRDVLHAELGNNNLFGDDGNDMFYARTAAIDHIDGGTGDDVAQVDPDDTYTSIESFV